MNIDELWDKWADYSHLQRKDLMSKDAFTKAIAEIISSEVCLHKNKRYEQQFTCEEIYCKDCGEYLGISG